MGVYLNNSRSKTCYKSWDVTWSWHMTFRVVLRSAMSVLSASPVCREKQSSPGVSRVPGLWAVPIIIHEARITKHHVISALKLNIMSRSFMSTPSEVFFRLGLENRRQRKKCKNWLWTFIYCTTLLTIIIIEQGLSWVQWLTTCNYYIQLSKSVDSK